MKSDSHSQPKGSYSMNAKFFDLKKEKQDRMINAALKIFALNGYSHASTDEIVKEAHISKGLLFHYFESKIGVYSFLADYSAKYFALELSSAIDVMERDYFKIKKMVENAKMQTMKTYPFMLFFINTMKKETHPEAVNATKDQKIQYENAIGTVYARAEAESFEGPNSDAYLKMLDLTLEALTEDHLRDESFNAESQYKENVSYIDVIAGLFKKES